MKKIISMLLVLCVGIAFGATSTNANPNPKKPKLKLMAETEYDLTYEVKVVNNSQLTWQYDPTVTPE